MLNIDDRDGIQQHDDGQEKTFYSHGEAPHFRSSDSDMCYLLRKEDAATDESQNGIGLT